MTDIRLYLVELENNQKNEATQIAANAAKRLQSREVRLVELIESAGEYLNHETPTTRERAMSFLAEVIANTPNGVLPLQHRNLLLEFVIARISDREVGIGSCAKALLALEERGSWDKAQATKVTETLMDFTYPLVECGTQSQRYPTLLLIDLLMAKYRTVLFDMSKSDPQFLSRFISYFDGEKDPRNLMIVFSVLNVIGTEWDASSCVQELFDAAFNYFPITFRPPPDNNFKITAQDLILIQRVSRSHISRISICRHVRFYPRIELLGSIYLYMCYIFSWKRDREIFIVVCRSCHRGPLL